MALLKPPGPPGPGGAPEHGSHEEPALFLDYTSSVDLPRFPRVPHSGWKKLRPLSPLDPGGRPDGGGATFPELVPVRAPAVDAEDSSPLL